MITVSIPIPEPRIGEFYARFADFITEDASVVTTPAPGTDPHGSPMLHAEGVGPDWLAEPGAQDRAARFWRDVTDAGRDLLRVLINGVEQDRARVFTPTELAAATDAKNTQSVAGTFGGVGKVIATHRLPLYEYKPGERWHFIWDWDPKRRLYSMSPEMAAMLRLVGA